MGVRDAKNKQAIEVGASRGRRQSAFDDSWSDEIPDIINSRLEKKPKPKPKRKTRSSDDTEESFGDKYSGCLGGIFVFVVVPVLVYLFAYDPVIGSGVMIALFFGCTLIGWFIWIIAT